MIQVHHFTFNPFQENTYILFDPSGECLIIDPGCHSVEEQRILREFIEEQGLTPVRLINTHCHIDHIFGNAFVANQYNLLPQCHAGEVEVLRFASVAADMYGIPVETSPDPGTFLEEGDIIQFRKSSLEILFTPGHSPASICLFSREQNFVISGDVLFYGSIGRTDLPGGNYDTLIDSIQNKLLLLGDHVKVYPGHGPATTIGLEIKNNPFLN
jgi:glyoxylase-like metal-dependent hydrolase (beta-lactamase superfamily II)